MWNGSHEKAFECVQGTFELCVRLKQLHLCWATDWPVSKLILQTAAYDIYKPLRLAQLFVLMMGHLILMFV